MSHHHHHHDDGTHHEMADEGHVKPFPSSYAQWLIERHVLLPSQQLLALLKKNKLLFLRSWMGMIVLLLIPVVLMLALELVISVMIQTMLRSATPDDPHPTPVTIPRLQPCIVGPSMKYCHTVSYTPQGAPFDGIIGTMLRDNGLPLEGTHKAFGSEDLLMQDIMNHPNTTLFSIVFDKSTNEKNGAKNVHYKIVYNGSIAAKPAQQLIPGIPMGEAEPFDYIHIVQHWMHQAIVKNHVADTVAKRDIVDPIGMVDLAEQLFEIDLVQFPTVGYVTEGFGFFPILWIIDSHQCDIDIVRTNVTVGSGQDLKMQLFYMFGPFFIQLCFCPFWMIGAYYMVAEREKMLRWSMTMMGMRNWTYWTSWLVSMLLIALVSVGGMILSGMLVGLEVFVNTSPLVLLFIFMPYALVMICYAFVIASFISNVRAALILAFTVNAITIIGSIFIANNLAIQLLYTGADLLRWVDIIVTILEWASPVFGLGKCITELIPFAFDGVYFGVGDMSRSHIKGYMRMAPTMWGSIGYMLFDCVLLLLLAWCTCFWMHFQLHTLTSINTVLT